MYVLNMTYIFVWSLGRTYFIIFFKQSSARNVFKLQTATRLNQCVVSPCVQKWELIVFQMGH